MELHFGKGINGKEDVLSNTIPIFSKNFMVLNCVFDFGFESADEIVFSFKANEKEINRIALRDCKDQYLTIRHMININQLIVKEENSVEISIVEHGESFDLKLNYI